MLLLGKNNNDMKTLMVLSNGVCGARGRKFYEENEGKVFDSISKAMEFFVDASMFELTDFMDLLNDEEYPTDSWVTYIYINY